MAHHNNTSLSFKRWLPLALLLAGVGAFFWFDLSQYLSFQSLKENRETLLMLLERFPHLAPLAFIVIYALVVAMSVPGATVMTLTGGFLFGTLFGTLYVVMAATLGATLLFLIARTALGDALHKKAEPWMGKLSKGFQENEFNYLLILRLIPLFPFFIVNLVPAFLGVKLRGYVLATFIGITPGTFVYTSFGAGIGDLFDAGETFDPSHILTPNILIALVGLAIFAALPVVYKKIKKR